MKHFYIMFLETLLCFLFVSCLEKNTSEFVYCNPNNGLLMRDTQIIPNYDDGKFYAVGTLSWGHRDSLGNAGFRLYVSEDLKNWEPGPWIMKQSELPDSAWYQRLYWAPEIHKINGKWYFTYNCSSNMKYDSLRYCDDHRSGIAVADKITGPYKPLSTNSILPYPTNDMTLFQDEDGKVYTFFNDGFFNMKEYPELKHSIYVAEIDLNNGQLKEKPHKLLTQTTEFESIGIEGAYVVKVDGFYYLFYSGFAGGYAVGYATAKNIYGPYTRAKNNPLFGARHDGALVKDGKLLTDIKHPFREIGHNQVFKGPDGRYWTSCHAYIKGGDNEFGSMLIIDPLEFKDGVIHTSAPTWTPQTVKVTSDMLNVFPGLGNRIP